jgi:predicted TIM-barrel fold metal-dependent hydrolase
MISRADTLDQQISSLTDRLQAAEDTIKKLNSQLEELVEAKNEHENHLMTSFVQVLNEKKLKIRNQQRLLASAKVDMGRGMSFSLISKKSRRLVDTRFLRSSVRPQSWKFRPWTPAYRDESVY